jgi:release factor glutamine methyltransferase
MTVNQILKEGIKILDEYNKEESKLDARLILESVLNCDRVYIILNGNKEITKEEYNNYINNILNRAKGIPLQHLIGKQQFMGLDFFVNGNVLIPRPETEELVELAMKIINENNFKTVMDIGTGSGCIPISLKYNIDNIFCIGVDISKDALKIASKNEEFNNISNIKWIASNLFDNIDNEYLGNIDLIISNPPYIPTKEISNLMTEVKDFEPISALDGGEDGLYFYKKISEQSKKYLKNGGYLLYEVGHDQCDEVMDILEYNSFKNISYKQDVFGVKRIVYAQKHE